MPSKDPINPKANEWMAAEGIVTQGPVSSRPKQQKKTRQQAGQVLRLARRLGKNPEDLAKSLPEDTIRRLKYPVLESRTPDGKREFKHDLGITEGPISR